MAATVTALRTYLGLDPASSVDADAMAMAVAAANDLVIAFRPDLTTAPAALPADSVFSALWQFSSSTVIADPGVRHFRASALNDELAISVTDDDGTDRRAELVALLEGDALAIRSTTTAGDWNSYTLTAPPADLATWVRLEVSLVSSGDLAAPPGGNDRLLFDFMRSSSSSSSWAPRAEQAALVEAARLYGRRGSVQGIAAFADMGVSMLPRLDPEVRSLLELGEYQRNVIA